MSVHFHEEDLPNGLQLQDGPIAIDTEAMGLLPAKPRPSWYDPGRFWSGDRLPLRPGWSYGVEVEVDRASR